jgi:hypothetical protein
MPVVNISLSVAKAFASTVSQPLLSDPVLPSTKQSTHLATKWLYSTMSSEFLKLGILFPTYLDP